MTIEQFAEEATQEFDESGRVSPITIDDYLDVILENFDSLSDYLEEDVLSAALERLKSPDYTYSSRVAQWAIEKQNELKIDFQDFQDFQNENENEDFEDFEDFENRDIKKLSAFNTEWLPRDFQQYADALSNSLQVPADMTGVSVLAIASGAVQKKLQISPKVGWYEPLNLYVSIVAKPSERKSPVQRAVTTPFYNYEKEVNEQRRSDISRYQIKKKILNKKLEDLIKSMTNTKKKEPVEEADIIETQRELDELEEVTELRLIADDITAEALIRLMKENNERMCIISSEGGIFQIMAGLYSNDKSNIDIYLKSLSGDHLNADRKGSGSIVLEHPLLTILLFVQPSVIKEIMDNNQFKGRGLLARFFYVFPLSWMGERKYETDAVPEWISDNYEMAIRELLEIPVPEEPETIYPDEEAYELGRDFYNEIEQQLPNDFEDIQEWAGKFHGQTMRIAGVLHCMEHRKNAARVKLTADTMKKAIEMGKYFLEHSRTAFETMGMMDNETVKEAKYILKKLNSYIASQNPKNPQKLNKSHFQQYCKGKFSTVDEMEPGLNELCERNFIRIAREATGGAGRPKEFIYINPKYIEKLEGEK